MNKTRTKYVFVSQKELHQSSAADRNKFTQTKSGDVATPGLMMAGDRARARVLKGKGGKEEEGWRRVMAEEFNEPPGGRPQRPWLPE